MPPAWLVSIVHFVAALGMVYEGRRKTDMLYKLRWFAMTFPFLYTSGYYAWVQLYDPDPAARVTGARWSLMMIGAPIAIYFINDVWPELCQKIRTKWIH